MAGNNFGKNLGPSRGIKTNAYGNPIKGNNYNWIIYVILSLVILLVILYVLHISKIINIPLLGKRKDE